MDFYRCLLEFTTEFKTEDGGAASLHVVDVEAEMSRELLSGNTIEQF